MDGGREATLDRQRRLGKLTARERIARLVDDGSFQEFGALVDAPRPAGEPWPLAPADGVVTGLGSILGRPASIMSYDFTVFGGTNGTTGGLKVDRCIERAMRHGIPLVMVLDGGGHRIQDGLDSRHYAWGADAAARLVDLSGYVPVVAVMLGPGFAGPSIFASLADFVVMVRGAATMGIAGPALVRAATGEKISNEELGGADVQARLGIADLAVDSEGEALDAVRVYLSYLPSNAEQPAPPGAASRIERDTPESLEVAELVPANPAESYDMREVVDSLADPNTVFEIKPEHARNVVTALARFAGRSVGVVANQPMWLGGAMDSPACEKAAHFVAVCDAFGLPLLFLIDVPGLLVGSESNRTQLARRSGRLLFEMGQATVPKFSVVLRKGYGAGYIAMGGGRGYDADLALAWPTAEICAMSIEGAVDVAFRRDFEAADDPASRRLELIDQFRAQVDPFLAAEGFGVDDVIEPAETRGRVIDALALAPGRRLARMPGKRRSISPI
jgi:propionyl-CoA carboxylase beta chain